MSMKVFISYSHKDAVAAVRLHTQLASFRREGRLDAWFDRRIIPGYSIDKEIARELESCGLFLMLVSPDFLASDYCVNREMRRALERHHAGEARVVPIIVESSSDWRSSPLGELKALPRDGKPISEWPNENSAYMDIVNGLRRILDVDPGVSRSTFYNPAVRRTGETQSGAGRYRVQRDFDQIDRAEFRDRAFRVIRDHFKKAIAEIDSIDDVRGRFEADGANSFRCTVVNRARNRNRGTAHIAMYCASDGPNLGDIYWSFSEYASANQANGMLNVNADEYELYLSSLMGIGFPGDRERLTAEEAAERVWAEFLRQAGIVHAS